MRGRISRLIKVIDRMELTHEQFKELMKVDWDIRTASAYCNQRGLTFDRSIKRWRLSRSIYFYKPKSEENGFQ